MGAKFSIDPKRILHRESNVAVNPGVFVKVVVTQLKFNQKDNKMLALCYLEDLASSEEVEKLMINGNEGLKMAEGEDAMQTVVFNEDTEVEETNATAAPVKSNFVDI